MKPYIILFFLITLMSCSNQSVDKSNHHEALDPLRFIDFGVVITDSLGAIHVKPQFNNKEVYQLLSDAVLPQGQLSDLEKMKLINLTTADIRSRIKFPLTEYCDVQDSIEFFKSMDTTIYSFDCSMLPNTVCFTGSEIGQILALDNEKRWTDFRNKYGKYGVHYFSIPLFNSNRTKAIIVTGGVGGSNTGSQELLLLEKIRSKWTISREVRLEIM